MPSIALQNWRGRSAAALDEIEAAHQAIGGSGRGRRYATRQVNHAYVVLLSSQFQRFCRDLHSECIDLITRAKTTDPRIRLLDAALTQGRKLEMGNPNSGNIGSDFGRFGIAFWAEVQQELLQNATRQKALEELNRWRNAIAHHDFDPAVLGKPRIGLADVRRWRRACDGLAQSFDRVLRRHLRTIIGVNPW